MTTSSESTSSVSVATFPTHVVERSPVGASPDSARVPLRLLLSRSPGHGALDGAWWPQSKQLELELADLVDHFPEKAGRIIRAVYSRPDWLPAPRRVKVARGFIKAGSFPRDDTHVILLGLSDREILHLLVVPPDSSPRFAREAMKTAATPTNLRSASTILAAGHEREREQFAAHWDDDGGAWLDPPPASPRAV
ncbi:MAG: DUF5994 family protein [Nocardioidaceae bacterium]